jgi:hypothetical protein
MATPSAPAIDASIFDNGPIRDLVRRSRWWSRRDLRVGLIPALVWLPMLALAVAQGYATSGVRVPFLRDVEVQTRFLVTLPLLLFAERYADSVLVPALGTFVDHGVIRGADRARFERLTLSAHRTTQSFVAFALLAAFVVVAGHFVWRRGAGVPSGFWYGTASADGVHLTWAGRWYSAVALPVYQFFDFRWVLRLLLWWRLLVRIARLDLHLVAMNPDRAGGIGFLGNKLYAFTPFVIAHGAFVAGLFADQVLYRHKQLQDLWPEGVGYAALIGVLVLGPLTAFTRRLVQAKRKGRRAYSQFATVYVTAFQRKWLERVEPTDEALGSRDIQSLADLANGSEIVRRMRFVPFGKMALIHVLALPFVLPILPLLFTTFSVNQVVLKVAKMVLHV